MYERRLATSRREGEGGRKERTGREEVEWNEKISAGTVAVCSILLGRCLASLGSATCAPATRVHFPPMFFSVLFFTPLPICHRLA